MFTMFCFIKLLTFCNGYKHFALATDILQWLLMFHNWYQQLVLLFASKWNFRNIAIEIFEKKPGMKISRNELQNLINLTTSGTSWYAIDSTLNSYNS